MQNIARRDVVFVIDPPQTQLGLSGPIFLSEMDLYRASPVLTVTQQFVRKRAMTLTRFPLLIFAATLASGAALADSRIQDVQQRNVYQEQRILDGLKAGSLSTREAAQLEREQQQILLMQVDALKRRGMTEAEQARVDAEQNRVSQHIAEAQRNEWRGNPNSENSRAMQEAVAQNVEQQRRIQQGLANGTLTNDEVLKLQRGQARVAALEAKSAKDGLSEGEQARIDKTISSQSDRIYDQKHDDQDRRENPPQ